jgi:hypothetical protein
MGNITELSAGERFDDQTGLPLAEGYLTLQSSAGNRVVFSDPAAMTAYRINNPGQFAGTSDASGSYNDDADVV